MIEIKTKAEQRQRAKTFYDFDYSGDPHSILDNEGNLPGAIGEIVVLDLFSQHFEVDHVGCKDYDLLINGIKTEIKTGVCKAMPDDRFFAKVCEHSFHQLCDVYFFNWVTPNLQTVTLCGYIRRKDFFARSKFYNKGQKAEDGFYIRENCRTLPIAELNQFDESKFIDPPPGQQMELFK